MATITITLPEGVALSQGKQISFTAPCDSTGVTGIIINGTTYTLVKANGGSLETGAFINGALISVLMDLTNHKAYIQNAAEVNVNADWNATEGDALILNKPTSMTPTAHNQAATTITVADSGGYFTGTNVETVLQEIGSTLNGLEAAITAIVG